MGGSERPKPGISGARKDKTKFLSWTRLPKLSFLNVVISQLYVQKIEINTNYLVKSRKLSPSCARGTRLCRAPRPEGEGPARASRGPELSCGPPVSLWLSSSLEGLVKDRRRHISLHSTCWSLKK